jgi:proteic killer suppression protein
VQIIFKNQLLFDLYEGRKTNNKIFRSNPKIIKQYHLVLLKLRKVDELHQLKQFRGLKYEYLKGNLKGYSSIRLNGKYRLIFREVNSMDENKIATTLEIIEISNHYQ